jgi:AcrR family transcriptional regulator
MQVEHPGPSLRQRNRLAAIHHIMDTAMELFERRGYRDVTVEEIAGAAGVSPRTFYRYFGTKEGLFTTDTYAAAGIDLLNGQVDLGDLPGTMDRVIATLSAVQGARVPFPGMRYVLEEPAVRGAVYAALDEGASRLAVQLGAAGLSPTQARVTARTYWFGVYFGALEQWHVDGRRRPLQAYVRDGLSVLAVAPPP